ncbi:CPBP family intramembrane glutamic endopeptidase [Companilactobacillus allii]|uniref:CPBP family intramembrane glutamic endopeptidase n=1 Tax=Companilactobacillus allii TaxID=1847728 RepID=UPI00178CD7C9|nr:CPBP family glutamic-type intramembrane protease [Companilactobacillus allii]
MIVEFSMNLFQMFLTQKISSIITVLLEYFLCISLLISIKSYLRNDFISIKTNKTKLILILIPLFIILSLAFQIVLQNIIPSTPSNQSAVVGELNNNSIVGLIMISILIVIIGPISEEILFQFFLQGKLANILNNKFKNSWITTILPIVFSTLLFMIYHLSGMQDILNLSIFTYSDLVLFAILYKITDYNILYPIAMHIGLNLISLIFTLM